MHAPSSTTNTRHDVAIVGIGCRYPGGINDAASFWRTVSEGRDTITEVPANRYDLKRFFDERPATPGRTMSRYGGFVEPIESFDAAFFDISPREAQTLDPHQRLLLEVAWEAIEDAGADGARLRGSRTGVYVGQWVNDFESRLFSDPDRIDFMMTTGSGRYAASGRLSYALGLRGPSVSIDTACSTSLVTVHLATRALRDGECSLALAGGANVILQPHITIAYSQSRMMAADGRCKFGDASGDGYVRSEGAGIVVLKRLEEALADGDRIYAVIRGSAVNNDGTSSGVLGRPSRIGHEEVLRAAYADADVAPAQVGYVEAHGTGTRAGDPVEIDALATVLGEGRQPGTRCAMGSVKTNIGHTESAAGVAGLIKATLALHHAAIPPSLHFKEPNPRVPWSHLPLEIAQSLRPWPAGTGPRVAGVNSFGISGTNAHAVLQEAPRSQGLPPLDTAAQPSASEAPALLVLSARSEAALMELAGRYARHLEDLHIPLETLAAAAATRRTALEHRLAVAGARGPMQAALRALGEGSDDVPADGGAAIVPTRGLVRAGEDGRIPAPRIVFVCPGQGAQWPGMARHLLDDADFATALERCDEAARPWLDVSLLDLLRSAEGPSAALLERIDVVQPALVALSIAYAHWLARRGITPQAVVGHSMGEVAAAHIAGALSLPDAMRIICRRSALMRRESGRGAMALVDLPEHEAQARLQGLEDRLAVAVVNSPRSCVLSGDPLALQNVMEALQRDQVFCRLVKVDVASHSPQMDEACAALAAELVDLSPGALRVPLVSTVLGREVAGHELDGAYWARNLRQPVRFASATQHLLEKRSAAPRVFVELGPHPVLLPSIEQTARSAEAAAITVPCGRRDEPERAALLGAVGALWAQGATPDWSAVHAPAPPRGFVDLPKYPWQRERHWSDAADVPTTLPSGLAQGSAPPRPSDETAGWLQVLQWRPLDATVAKPVVAATAASCLVVADDAQAGEAMRDALRSLDPLADLCNWAALDTALGARPELGTLLVWLPDARSSADAPLRAWQAMRRHAPRARLVVVSHGAQVVAAPASPAESDTRSPTALPSPSVVWAAAAWGAARVIAQEHPEARLRLIDLDPGLPLHLAAADLATALRHDDGEDQLAWRGGQRHVLRVLPCEVPAKGRAATAPSPWRADGTVLITGGLGGVGLHLAKALVTAGVRRLVLLGRQGLPPRTAWAALEAASPIGRRVAAVRALEAAGAAVHIATADMGDAGSLQAFLAQWEAEGWPRIHAVVHAAGTLSNALASDMDQARFDAVVGPKLAGAVLLDQLLPELDVMVLVSSTGAWLAQAGQANYAAANAGLDALAEVRSARGRRTRSIGWGVWRDTGMVANEAGHANVGEMNRQGIGTVDPSEGAKLFAWLCSRDDLPPHVSVLPIDWARHAEARGHVVPPLLRERCAAAPPRAAFGGGAMDLAAASPVHRRRTLEALAREAIGRVLKLPPARIDPRQTFGSLGMTSLLAMELRNRLEAALARPLSATLAWNHPTLSALVDFLDSLLGAPEAARSDVSMPAAQAPEAAGPMAPPPSSTEAVAAADLTDEEAALALRGRRSGSRH